MIVGRCDYFLRESPMLMLTRKRGEKIMIGPNIELVVTAVRGDRVQLGFAAPPGVPIYRKEIFLRMQTERAGLAAARSCRCVRCRAGRDAGLVKGRRVTGIGRLCATTGSSCGCGSGLPRFSPRRAI